MAEKTLKDRIRVDAEFDRISVYLDDDLIYLHTALNDEEIVGIISVETFIETLISHLELKDRKQ